MTRYVRVETEERFGPGHVKKVYAGDRRSQCSTTTAPYLPSMTRVLPSAALFRTAGVVTCPWHGAQFPLTDGRSLGPDEFYRRLEIYELRVRSGVIELKIE